MVMELFEDELLILQGDGKGSRIMPMGDLGLGGDNAEIPFD